MGTWPQFTRTFALAGAVTLALLATPPAAGASDPHAAATGGNASPTEAAGHAAGGDRLSANGLPGGTTGGLSTDATFDPTYEPMLDAALDPGLADGDPWTRWFSALEQSSAGAGGLLYPLDASSSPPAARPYRHLAIAKAVTRLEQAAPAGVPGHGTGADTHGDPHSGGHSDSHAAGAAAGDSPLLALANARNYLNLTEYDQALNWYAQAGARDPEGHFRRETGREALAAAICARDTVAAGRAIAATMAAVDLAGREAEYVLAMRWLLGRRDAATLGWFVDRCAAPELSGDVRVAFWRAYSLSWLDRRAEALEALDALLAMGGREQALGARERGWALTAWADLTLLSGNRDEAERRYVQLSSSGTPTLRDWGRLQAAAIAFVANRYGEAAAGFREICQAEAKGAWADHACAMADMAARLERLLNEGERYGAAAHYAH